MPCTNADGFFNRTTMKCEGCEYPYLDDGEVDTSKWSGFDWRTGLCYSCSLYDKYVYTPNVDPETGGVSTCKNCVDDFKSSYQFWSKPNQTCESCGTGFIFKETSTKCETCASDVVRLTTNCCAMNVTADKYTWNADNDLDCGACVNDTAS